MKNNSGRAAAVKTLVMTGGTSGFGRRAVERLLRTRSEWRIILLARDPRRGHSLQADAEGRVHIVPADLASLESIDHACDEVVSLLGSDGIDAMSFNAGMQGIGADAVSQDGYELTFAVNHLAHFAIAGRLTSHLRPRGRVVITASEVHDPDAFCLMGIARATWQDPAELADVRLSQMHMPAGVERGEARYSASKLLNVMHARLLARELPSAGVVSFNPSVVPGTEIARGRNVLQQWSWKYVLPLAAPILPGMRSMERSASDLVWLLTEADSFDHGGAYINGAREEPGSADSRDASKIARMRAVSEHLIAQARVQHRPLKSARGQLGKARG
jgi:NAD(P)-dependent dehydrogenase (short-subunit alcohol dehydrogenase family)